ncbi:MAG: redoxin family protein [Lachnospiraceae bacterium]|nr:redoxin family protein [Lachnospiraceae bacterium]
MNFNLDISVTATTVLIQGLLSFFSPCVFPLVPLYIGYFSGGAKKVDEDGTIYYPQGRVLLHTIFFVLGISAAFFLLGFGFTALGQFFSDNQYLFAKISGIIMIFFGLYQLGLFGHSNILEQERKLPFRLDKMTMGPLPALLLGFTFSFAWTPCVGPTLSSVLLLAGSTGNAARGLGLIFIYTLGFVLPFLAVGLFTRTVLEFFKKYKNVVRYTVKIGALLLIFMGIMTLTGFMNGLTAYLSRFDGLFLEQAESIPENSEVEAAVESQEPVSDEDDNSSLEEVVPAPDFTLTDQNGNIHTLSDYKGQTVFLNFWATWCPPCRSEMPEIQKLYEEYGYNEGDLVVLGVAAPGVGQEGDLDYVKEFLSENGYTFPVAMDSLGVFTSVYSIRAYPTTFMISEDGSVYGYVEGALTEDLMHSIVEQTMEAN